MDITDHSHTNVPFPLPLTFRFLGPKGAVASLGLQANLDCVEIKETGDPGLVHLPELPGKREKELLPLPPRLSCCVSMCLDCGSHPPTVGS